MAKIVSDSIDLTGDSDEEDVVTGQASSSSEAIGKPRLSPSASLNAGIPKSALSVPNGMDSTPASSQTLVGSSQPIPSLADEFQVVGQSGPSVSPRASTSASAIALPASQPPAHAYPQQAPYPNGFGAVHPRPGAMNGFVGGQVPVGFVPGYHMHHPQAQAYHHMVHNGYGGLGGGLSASDAIDITNLRIPSPPKHNPRKPICVGSLRGSVIMPVPAPCAIVGARSPDEHKERYEVLNWRETEYLKVKLKLRKPGKGKDDQPWTHVNTETVQVMTPHLTAYIGDLEFRIAQPFVESLQNGHLRLEGFLERVPAEGPLLGAKINVLVFTLPSNKDHVANCVASAGMRLLKPEPPYDPLRHPEQPEYDNPHDQHFNWNRMQMHHQQLAMMQAQLQMNGQRIFQGQGTGAYPHMTYNQNRFKQEDWESKIKESVFDALEQEQGKDYDLCDPGVLVKTPLFPHQRKALCFLLRREHDEAALKEGKRNHEKWMKREAKRAGKLDAGRKPSISEGEKEATVAKAEEAVDLTVEDGGLKVEVGDTKVDASKGNGVKAEVKDEGDVEVIDGSDFKKTVRDKSQDASSLWEVKGDMRGSKTIWKNKLTGEEKKGKVRPYDGKGSILADDMGLGKTLTIIALIAATRQSALSWSKTKLEKPTEPEEKRKPELSAAGFKNRVFGMPDVDESDSSVGKKRKREDCRDNPIKVRAKTTLLVSPMSTINNWQTQLSEHWNGKVEVCGGEKGIAPSEYVIKRRKHRKGISDDEDDETEDFDILRVCIYHGPQRRSDPGFLAQFDLVVTSYNVLSLEYSRMCSSLTDESSTPSGSADVSPADTPGPEDDGDVKRAKKGKGVAVKRSEMSALQSVDWFRVVLDEAHYIKTPSTVMSRAACCLKADRRIAMSGTPIQNKIEDIWALFKFIRLDPVDVKEVFNERIGTPCKTGDNVGVARLQLVMRCCALRRTKESKREDGVPILQLPQRHDTVIKLTLNESESEAYQAVVGEGKEKVQELEKQGKLGKNIRNVLQELLKLRQICDHVELANTGETEEDYDGSLMEYNVAVQGIEREGLNLARAQSVVANRKATEGDELDCVGCGVKYDKYFPALYPDGDLEPLTDLARLESKPLFTKCLHIYCMKCFKTQVHPQYRAKMKECGPRPCTACGTGLRLPVDVIEVYPPSADGPPPEEEVKKKPTRKRYTRAPGEDIVMSTKLAYLHDDLMKFSRRNPYSIHYDASAEMVAVDPDEDAQGRPTKSIVFSQWTSMLDRIGDMLDYANIKYDRLDGTMTLAERARAMDAIRSDRKGVEVLLVSLRAGGVGLNLTEANRVYLVEPYWNPAVEAQAVDRIHRMGQRRPVTSIRLVVQDSIETKMQELQEKKAKLANMGLTKMTRQQIIEQRAEMIADIFR